ncbi:Breast cancer 1, early onset [Mortierella sp. AD094]|nr:Breast cancer 1, early onset [Mortierella sp. AD094]
MNATARRNNAQPLPQALGEEQESQQREILPDTIVGILLRMQEEFKCSICLGTMEEPVSTGCNHRYCRECIHHALDRTDGCPLCKAHVTKRSLNRVEHLERLIESFIRLKSVFEREDGFTLSQVPRRYNAEPIENLSQFFPYPEKPGEPSHSVPEVRDQTLSAHNNSAPQQDDAFASESDCNSNKPENTLHTNVIAVKQQPDLGPNVEIDVDCFDIDLDTISAQEAAFLAESMMSMMSSVTLGEGVYELPPSDPVQRASPQGLQPNPRNDLTIQQPDLSKVKLEDLDDSDLPTLPLNTHLSLEMPKLENASILEEAGLHDCSPTQEPPSKETSVVLCGTFMSSAKKQQMENAAKLLKSRTVDDLAVRPTHVVMDIRITASVDAGYWVDETSYQIYDNEFGCNAPKRSRASHLRGDPPLFAGYEVQISGAFTKPTKEEVELMIRAGGGVIVPQLFLRDTRFARSIASQRNNDQASDRNESDPVRHLLLYDQANDGVMSLKKLKTEVRMVKELGQSLGKQVEVTQCKILFDCIAQYDMSQLVETSDV